MRESTLEAEVCKVLRAEGAHTLKMTQLHWPDRLFVWRTAAVFVEFKSATGALTLGQATQCKRLAMSGCTVMLARPDSVAYFCGERGTWHELYVGKGTELGTIAGVIFNMLNCRT
jgi:hypothetical protein